LQVLGASQGLSYTTDPPYHADQTKPVTKPLKGADIHVSPRIWLI